MSKHMGSPEIALFARFILVRVSRDDQESQSVRRVLKTSGSLASESRC